MNLCTHPTTTTRIVPIEIPRQDDAAQVSSIPDAVLHTCTVCEASFYLSEVWKKTPVPVQPPKIQASEY